MDDPGVADRANESGDPGFNNQRRPLSDHPTLTVEAPSGDVERFVTVRRPPLERRSLAKLPLDPPE
jgi:hypothetical protein